MTRTVRSAASALGARAPGRAPGRAACRLAKVPVPSLLPPTAAPPLL